MKKEVISFWDIYCSVRIFGNSNLLNKNYYNTITNIWIYINNNLSSQFKDTFEENYIKSKKIIPLTHFLQH